MAYRGVGSYYGYQPRQVYAGVGCGCSGFGAAAAFKFNGADAWSKWTTCNTAFQVAKAAGKTFSGVPACNVVNDIRVALSQVGFGMGAGQGVIWTAADQAAIKDFCASRGISCPSGLPTKDNLLALETTLKSGEVPGTEPVPTVTPGAGGQYIVGPSAPPSAPAPEEKKGLATANMLLIGVGALALIAIIAAVAKRKGGAAPAPMAKAAPSHRP